MRTFQSDVANHKGTCKAVWLNRNQVCERLGDGITGFFKLVRRNRFGFWQKYGPEFHGIIRYGESRVESTAL